MVTKQDFPYCWILSDEPPRVHWVRFARFRCVTLISRRECEPCTQPNDILTLDPTREPFSRFGTWLSIALQPEDYGATSDHGSCNPLGPGWYIRCHHARAVIQRELFKLEISDEAVTATPTELRIDSEACTASIVFTADGSLRIAGRGTLRLRMPNKDRFGVAYRNGSGTRGSF